MFGWAFGLTAVTVFAHAGDNALSRPIAVAAPLEIPHAADRLLAEKARKRDRKARNIESVQLPDLASGFTPLTWPKNTDMRARLMTPELRGTPVVGWIAANLYRSKKDNGWCLELDPGQGEYVVFYRINLK